MKKDGIGGAAFRVDVATRTRSEVLRTHHLQQYQRYRYKKYLPYIYSGRGCSINGNYKSCKPATPSY